MSTVSPTTKSTAANNNPSTTVSPRVGGQEERRKVSSGIFERNLDLDIIKGSMVFIMLLYHCVSVSPYAALRVINNQIYFIHSAFLVVTGFLCGFHYYAPARLTPKSTHGRLLLRGGKLLGLMMVANVVFHALGYGRAGWERMSKLPGPEAVIRELLVTVPGDALAFEVLYLISIFLVFAAIIIRLPFLKALLAVMLLLPVFTEEKLLLFLAFGCAGMLLGVATREARLNFVASWKRDYLWIFPVLLAARILFIPPSLTWLPGNQGKLVTCLLETAIWFCTCLWCVQRLSNEWFQRQIILLGRYTLLAYVVQMVFARVMYLILSRLGLRDFVYYGVSLGSVTLLTWLVVFFVGWLRRSWSAADRGYRIVFQ